MVGLLAGCGAQSDEGASIAASDNTQTAEQTESDTVSDEDSDPQDPVRLNDWRPAGYETLLLADEFDGSALNRALWCTRMPWGTGAALQVLDDTCTSENGLGYGDYANVQEQHRFRDFNTRGEPLHVVGGGTIKLRATKTASDAYTAYESAALRSKITFKPNASTSFYVTSRVRFSDVLGSLPSMFLIPSARPDETFQWPPEIDIYEAALNGEGENIYSMTMHSQVGGHSRDVVGNQTNSGYSEWFHAVEGFSTVWGIFNDITSLRERWVELGVEWAVDGVCYFVDGRKVGCENYRWVANNGESAMPATLIAYLAIGGVWAGRNGIDDSRFPMAVEIDHIRVYQGNGTFVSAQGLDRTAIQN